jgi:HPr kinase/phosphorylase
VLNIKDLFGVAAVRERKRIDLVIKLLGRDEEETWDRLGLDEEWYEILGARIPLKRLPVRPGKNTASTVEVAARNELLRQAGHHSAGEFHARLAAALGVADPSLLNRDGIDPGPPAPRNDRALSPAPPPGGALSSPPPAPSGERGGRE